MTKGVLLAEEIKGARPLLIEDYAKKRHTPSLRATPLSRGDPIN